MADFDELADLIKRHREAAVLGSLTLKTPDVAIVAGAYKGETIAFLRALYPELHIIGYEPQLWAFIECAARFRSDAKIEVFPFGIGAVTCDTELQMGEHGTDAASFVPDPAARTFGIGTLKNVVEEFQRLKLAEVALMVLNIEGYEYELLACLDSALLLPNITNLVIQFHDIERSPLVSTFEMLNKTHWLRWHYAPWNAWSWTWWECR